MVREINTYLRYKKVHSINNSPYTKKAELHCHSKRGRLSYAPFIYDSVQTVEEIILEALAKDIKILSITDHNSLDGYFEAVEFIRARKSNILLIPGCEISTTKGHILALGIREEIRPRLHPRETIRQIRMQGGVAIAAHPFVGLWSGRLIKLLEFDAIEGLNSSMTIIANRQALHLGNRLGLPITAGSDAHQRFAVGDGCMVFRDNIRTQDEVLNAIKERDFTVQFRHSGFLPMIISHLRSHKGFLFKDFLS